MGSLPEAPRVCRSSPMWTVRAAVRCTMNSHIGSLTRLLGLIHKHKMDSLKKRGQGATASYFVEKGAESNGHTAGLIVVEELRASLISDIKVSGLVMVTPKQARKLTQDLRREQGLHISQEFLQGQVGLIEAQHSSEQNEGSTGTVSLTSAKESLDAKGDALGRKAWNTPSRTLMKCPSGPTLKRSTLKRKVGPHSKRRRQPSAFSPCQPVAQY